MVDGTVVSGTVLGDVLVVVVSVGWIVDDVGGCGGTGTVVLGGFGTEAVVVGATVVVGASVVVVSTTVVVVVGATVVVVGGGAGASVVVVTGVT